MLDSGWQVLAGPRPPKPRVAGSNPASSTKNIRHLSSLSVSACFVFANTASGRDGRIEVEFDPKGTIWVGGSVDVRGGELHLGCEWQRFEAIS
jgi:hypothetical protein